MFGLLVLAIVGGARALMIFRLKAQELVHQRRLSPLRRREQAAELESGRRPQLVIVHSNRWDGRFRGGARVRF